MHLPNRSRTLAIALVLVALVVGVRLALPWWLERHVNEVIDRNEHYAGSISDVDVALLRGGYVIEDLELDHREKEERRPLLRAKRVDLTLRWGALWHGALVGEVDAEGVVYTVVAAPPAAADELAQTGGKAGLGDRLSELFPFSIDRLEVRDGQFHYRDPHTSPTVDVALREAHLIATNWSNVRDAEAERYGRAWLRARAFRSARFVATLEADPLASPPDFRFAGFSEGIDLTELNEVLLAYAGVDAEEGSLAVYTEVSSTDAGFSGYVKPVIRDLDVLGDEGGDWSERLWEGFVGLLAEVFENQFSGRQATKIPIEGEWGEASPGVLEALGNVFYNAFIQALPPRLEHPERLAVRRAD